MSVQTLPRLLVVDDDLGVIAAYRLVLEGNVGAKVPASDTASEELFGPSVRDNDQFPGWRVHFVDQGEDAVLAMREAAANSDPFSAVFLDIRMPPGIDGHETALQIRTIDPTVHIVFVSAYSDYTSDELAEAAGPDHRMSVLSKPVWPDQLIEKARNLCRAA
jgi:CheY-like chemotaxis protein